jgi:predicted transposase/invertase (TIGR01784 family)
MSDSKSTIDKKYDSLFKQSFADIDVVKAALTDALPRSIIKHIDLSSLKPSNASFIDDEFKQSHSDIVFEVKTNAGNGYLCIVEHQSSVDEFMVIRFIEYVCKAIRHHIKQGHKHYPVVIPVLIYNGKATPYPYSTDFFDYFENTKVAKSIMLKPFPLVDLSATPDDKLLENPLTAYPYLLLKYMQFKKDLLPMIIEMCKRHLISTLLAQDKRHLLENLIYFTMKEAELSSKEAFAKAITEESSELGAKTMTLLETEYRNGMQKGIEQNSLEIAKNMLRDDEPIEKVCRFTGLDQKIVIKLDKNIKK